MLVRAHRPCHHRQGRTGVGTSARYELSRHIIAEIERGKELADVMDALSGQQDVRSHGGAMGPHMGACGGRSGVGEGGWPSRSVL